jgi:hypothetical protein
MTDEHVPASNAAVEPWMQRLKAAYDAGYYRTEAAEGFQTRFPWQDRTCGDCPFWIGSSCLVRGARRGARDATCRYFDPWNRAEAESIIQYNKIRPLRTRVRLHGDEQAA